MEGLSEVVALLDLSAEVELSASEKTSGLSGSSKGAGETSNDGSGYHLN